PRCPARPPYSARPRWSPAAVGPALVELAAVVGLAALSPPRYRSRAVLFGLLAIAFGVHPLTYFRRRRSGQPEPSMS
ncbi:MAG: hypothetical protein ACRDPY_44025, partial [Streptosporangiaceae bacterium]